tara:strand:- start:2093 stop:2554 length:462 start_codon:yes stop_codon:yes gene_type:complete
MSIKNSFTKSVFLFSLLSTSLAAVSSVAEAPSTVGAHYVPQSSSKVLAPGEKVANLFNLNMTTPYILQRITENTYWYQSGFYGTIFYIGDKGVLLFDPLEQRAEPILKSIRSITDKPITAIVYSHDHADHISGADDLLKLLKNSQKEQPKIIA